MAQDMLAKANQIILTLNKILMDNSNKFTRDQLNKIIPLTTELSGAVGAMSVEIGRLEGETSALKQVSNSPSPTASTIESPSLIEALSELNDREVRAKNFLIFDVPEPTDTTPDSQVINNVLRTIAVDAKITRIHRLGLPSADKLRPVKITLDCSESVKTVLSRRRALANNFKIKPDLTPIQRGFISDKWKELNTRRAAGEEGLIMKYRNGMPYITKNNTKN
jgi:hypothetical protein